MSGKFIALLNPRTWRHDQFQNVSELRAQSIKNLGLNQLLINQFQINLAESKNQYMKTLARIGL